MNQLSTTGLFIIGLVDSVFFFPTFLGQYGNLQDSAYNPMLRNSSLFYFNFKCNLRVLHQRFILKPALSNFIKLVHFTWMKIQIDLMLNAVTLEKNEACLKGRDT